MFFCAGLAGNKENYLAFSERESELPVFARPWWLDAVCGPDGWDVVLVEKGGEVVASMPYHIRRWGGLTFILMPPLTPWLGPYVKYPPGQRYAGRLAWEKQLFSALLKALPNFHFFHQNLNPTLKNGLPFYWMGFCQSVRYTYLIEPKHDIQSVQGNYDSALRRRLKKAIREGVVVKEDDGTGGLYRLMEKTFERKNRKVPVSETVLGQLFSKAQVHGKISILKAQYKGYDVAAGLFLVDQNRMYYMAGGIDPAFKDVGAMDFLMHCAIEKAMERGLLFDFEGSMEASVEAFFRRFGAVQQPYLAVYREKFPWPAMWLRLLGRNLYPC